MMNWILERAKAFVAFAAPGVVTALMKAAEQATGFDIPGEWETAVLMLVTSLVVYQVPNKRPV